MRLFVRGYGSGSKNYFKMPFESFSIPIKSFSIFIPIYNEETILISNISVIRDFLKQLNLIYEIILVSNGSTDQTNSLGSQLASTYPEISFYTLNKKGIVGTAFKMAALHAKYPILINLDIDLPINLSFIPQALQSLESNDIVIGAKILGFQNRHFIRKFGSWLYVRLANRFLKTNIQDFSSCGKAYRIDKIKPFLKNIGSGVSFCPVLLYLAENSGLRIHTVSVECLDQRKSKFGLVKLGFTMYKGLFSLFLLKRDKKSTLKKLLFHEDSWDS